MKIGILSRGPGLYSTQSIWQAGRRRGHEMYIIDHTRCSLMLDNHRPNIIYRGKTLHMLDAVIPRIGASVTSLGAAVISQFELMGVVTPTNADALLRARDKLRCLQSLATAGIPVPRTVMVGNGDSVFQLADRVGGLPVVVKLLESTHGMGVELADSLYALQAAVESFQHLNERVLLQEFIAEAQGADTRVLVVDREIVATMRRQAQAGEFRSNLHRGANASVVKLNEEDRQLVARVVEVMQLDVAGVDLLYSNRGTLVMEVNASPGLEGIEQTTGVDVSGHIIRMVENLVRAARRRRREEKDGNYD